MKSSISKFFMSIVFIGVAACSASSEANAQDDITRQMALKLTQACVTAVPENDWPPLAIAIYNKHGQLVMFQAMDGVIHGAINLALGKAKTSASFPASTMELASLINADKGAKGLKELPDFVSVQGGMPIMIEGKHVGGIGVSGAQPKQDEMCARIALEQF